ncbi:MAG: lactonase family protein [Candidatus Bipolaricaulota bacterium]|nr:lactonase family protein [Candidatus Bipolaricaulota bacterium]
MKVLSRGLLVIVLFATVGWASALVAVSQAPVVRELHPGPPNMTPIAVATDVDQIIFADNFGYSIGTIITDNTFIDRWELPNKYERAKNRIELGIPHGTRGTRGFALGVNRSRFFVADTAMNQVSVWKNEFPSEKAGDKRVAAVPDIDTPQAVVCTESECFVTSGVNEPVLIRIVPGADDTYKIEERLELHSEAHECNNPRAMALSDAGALFIACAQSHTVLKVSRNPLRVVAHAKLDVAQDALPYDVALRNAGGKVFVYTVNMVSETISMLEDQGSALQLQASTRIPPAPGDPVVGRPERTGTTSWAAVTSPDGRFVYVANASDQSVSTVCAATNKVLATWRSVDETSIRMADVVAHHPTLPILYMAEGGARIVPYIVSVFYWDQRFAAECP